MNIFSCDALSITAYKSGKGQPWNWKPKGVGHWSPLFEKQLKTKHAALSQDQYDYNRKMYSLSTQIFFLWFVIEIDLKPKDNI